MQVIFTDSEMPQSFSKSLFLAGPSSRNKEEVPSWRPDAIKLLDDMGYNGVIFVPEGSDGGFKLDYDDQVGWEEKYLNACDCILFWIPRDLSPDSKGHPKMAALTTNVEFGAWADSGKVVLGAPEEAEKVSYLKHYAEEYNVPISDTLTDTLRSAMDKLGEGAERSGGERYIPLFIWKLSSFQSWYKAQTGAGNVLETARLLYTFRPRFKDFVFLWVLQVNIYVSSEDRYKSNEVVVSRPDTSSVMLWYHPSGSYSIFDIPSIEVVLVKEFRSPASTPDGFIHELPSGSAPDNDYEEAASHELHEETGFYLEPSRLKKVATRQLAGTFSAHKSHLYSAQLTQEEVEWFKSQRDIPHGVEKDTERTFVEIKTIKEILDEKLVDWTTLGMIFSVINAT
jgi:8-oxo-dGTP pyrophosphatase MutT (NUDIX family)